MSAPMSVKERIAMMKQKEEEEKANKAQTKTTEPPVRRSSISDRAAFNKSNSAEEIVSPSSTVPAPTAESNPGSATSEPPKVSIAERMAALKANSASNRSVEGPSSVTNNSEPQNGAVTSETTASAAPTVSERMAALRRKSVGPTDIPPPPSPPVPTPVVEGPDGSTTKGSVAERIAMLRAASAPVHGPESKTPILIRSPSANTNTPPPPQASSGAYGEETNTEPISPPKMTIAERMAALKASAESHSTPTDEPGPSGVTPISTGGRRVSIGLVGLGAKINLAALSPNAVRPPIKKDIEAEAGDATQEKAIEEEDGALTPKSNRVSFSAQENGEFKHLSLSRPAVLSVRRKNTTASVRLSPSAWQSSEDMPDGLSVVPTSPRTPSTAASSRPVSLSGTVLSPVVDNEDEEEKSPAVEAPVVEETVDEEPLTEEPLVVVPPPPPPRRPSVIVGAPPPPPPPAVPAGPSAATAPPPPAVSVSPPAQPSASTPPPPPPPAYRAASEPAEGQGDTEEEDAPVRVVAPPPPPPRRPSVVLGAPPPPPPPLSSVFAAVQEETISSEVAEAVSTAPPPPPPPVKIDNSAETQVGQDTDTEQGELGLRDEQGEQEECVTPSKKDPRFALL